VSEFQVLKALSSKQLALPTNSTVKKFRFDRLSLYGAGVNKKEGVETGLGAFRLSKTELRLPTRIPAESEAGISSFSKNEMTRLCRRREVQAPAVPAGVEVLER
jgi:hypothetical protein